VPANGVEDLEEALFEVGFEIDVLPTQLDATDWRLSTTMSTSEVDSAAWTLVTIESPALSSHSAYQLL
jgi:hypothetical protein